MKLKKLKSPNECLVPKNMENFNWYIKNGKYEYFCVNRIQENSSTKKPEYFVYCSRLTCGWEQYTATSSSNFKKETCRNLLRTILQNS